MDEVAAYPALAGKVRAYIRVADRRWDILLENGVRIMLPEDEPMKALAEVERRIAKSIFCPAILLRSICVLTIASRFS